MYIPGEIGVARNIHDNPAATRFIETFSYLIKKLARMGHVMNDVVRVHERERIHRSDDDVGLGTSPKLR